MSFFLFEIEKVDIVNTNADEKQKDINHVNEDKLLFEKEEKDINNNDKNAQQLQIEPMYSVSIVIHLSQLSFNNIIPCASFFNRVKPLIMFL